MAAQDLPIVGDSFAVGFRFQRHWDSSMANAFFFGELGAGFFLVSLLVGFHAGMIAGILITAVLKSFFHLTHMGVPGRSWRAILRPDRSWVSRGLIGIVALVAFGGSYAVVKTFGLAEAWGLPSFLMLLLEALAIAAAVVVMTYQGFAMSHSTAIALWSTGLMPVSSLVYAVTAGMMLTLACMALGLYDAAQGAELVLSGIAIGLLFVIGIVLLALLHGAHHGSPGGRKSVEVLTRTFYAKPFLGIVWGVGIALPLVALALGGGTPGGSVIAAAAMLAGYYAFRQLMFKAGVFEPIMSFKF